VKLESSNALNPVYLIMPSFLLESLCLDIGMLEDFIVGMQSLLDVKFRFSESMSATDDYMENQPVITGNRYLSLSCFTCQ